MGAGGAASGPDFSQGIALGEIPPDGTLAGRVGDDPVLLSRIGGELFAVGGACTHYGGALGDGLIHGDTVRCPLHHACFSLRTGAAHQAPALDGLDRWRVEVADGKAFVRTKLDEPPPARATPDPEVRSVVIVGGGAAGLACANELRALGYSGAITMLSADGDPPCDRPNLSKDYLAGNAPEEWIPLRSGDWYADQAIDLRLDCEVVAIDTNARRVRTAAGDEFGFDRLLLATGSDARRLPSPDFDRDNVFTLRSLADARALIAAAQEGTRAAIVGSSFIGLETAAALRARGVEVDVVAPEAVPFAGVLGPEVGGFLQRLHERKGVRFHLGQAVAGFDGLALATESGERIAADFVIVGIGAAPRLDLARSAGFAMDHGVVVDSAMRTSAPGIFAAGDIALFPDPATGEPVWIEHWVVAERHGQVAAANMLGIARAFDSTPFFWTEQHGVTVRYSGHARRWDEVRIDGDLDGGRFAARYLEKGVHRATATVGCDMENLMDARALAEA
jgi:NADPH-dependent 2,4-dienoyl-CoA reductase/sulfur reductase-like enzyme/nitrite reductase/ring-hydroxylating ferredoxin subunit